MFILRSILITLTVLLACHTAESHNHELSMLMEMSNFDNTPPVSQSQTQQSQQPQINFQTPPVPQTIPQTFFQPQPQLKPPTATPMLQSQTVPAPAPVSQSLQQPQLRINNNFDPSQAIKSQFPMFQSQNLNFQTPTQLQTKNDFNKVPQQMAQAAFQQPPISQSPITQMTSQRQTNFNQIPQTFSQNFQPQTTFGQSQLQVPLTQPQNQFNRPSQQLRTFQFQRPSNSAPIQPMAQMQTQFSPSGVSFQPPIPVLSYLPGIRNFITTGIQAQGRIMG